MRQWKRGILLHAALAACVLAAVGCGDQGSLTPPSPEANTPEPVATSVPIETPEAAATETPVVLNPTEAAPVVMAAGGTEAIPDIEAIMRRLNRRGPQALTTLIGTELEATPPVWAEIQPQTQEYVQLTGDLGKNTPPKGSPESWTALTAAYLASAESLNQAVLNQNLDAALAAHKEITDSCNACHQEHRPAPQRGGGQRGGGQQGGAPAAAGG